MMFSSFDPVLLPLAVPCLPASFGQGRFDLPFQIGVSTDRMSALVAAPIGLLPIIGETNRLNDTPDAGGTRIVSYLSTFKQNLTSLGILQLNSLSIGAYL